MSSEKGLSVPGWVAYAPDVLVSDSYGDLSIGPNGSYAKLAQDKVFEIEGKILTLSGQPLAKVGQSWEPGHYPFLDDYQEFRDDYFAIEFVVFEGIIRNIELRIV